MSGSRSTNTVVVGGGHSGLAMSKRLSVLGIDHVVLEKGEVAASWRTPTMGLVHPADPELADLRFPGSATRATIPTGS